MEELVFETLSFEEKEHKVKVIFLRLFYFDISKSELAKIGNFEIGKNSLSFDAPAKRAARRFNDLLAKGFENLTNKITGKRTVYIHKGSGIPLIGYISFGIIDRGTNLLEVRPITGCNLRCLYCSVNEDKRQIDFVVEKEYIVDEFKKVVKEKAIDDIEAHISSQGETCLYADLPGLIRDIMEIKAVKKISIDTNGTLLSKRLVDELIESGLTQFNLSINALDHEKARQIADAPYSPERISEIAKYISTRAELLITPVWVPGINDKEIGRLIEFTKSLENKKFKPKICLQNFLEYKYGRNPVKAMPMEDFYAKLRELEKEHDVKLHVEEQDFNIHKAPMIKKPFKKGDKIEAVIVGEGRLPGEKLAVAKGRVIAVRNYSGKGKVRVTITKSKHNLFYGSV